ncbi:FAD binding domain-containing protein [Massilia niastensis]|uniref:FAD binding domain-containing protein n=1 Tax=Massilia niastensis TaxID=544911 RepID=UPI0003605358|nr:FAD-dependent monooxygenase [Massilia niastensis]
MHALVAMPRALVIGGSLGGLLAANALRAAGWDVDVFERSVGELSGRGGGIVLQADVLQAFQFAGLVHDPVPGVRSIDRIYLSASDRVLQRSPMPQAQTSWNVLYRILRDGLPPERLHGGASFTSYEQDGQRVTAHFADGRSEAGDLLVGADGARSTVRAQMLPGLEPAYAGYVAWRGSVPEALLPAALRQKLDASFVFQQGDAHLLLAYLVPGDDGSVEDGRRRWNWIWYRRVGAGGPLAALLTGRDGRTHTASLPPGEVREEHVAALLGDAVGLAAPSFRTLLEATAAPFVQAIVDLQTPAMLDRRVLLLGDAAFVPRPHAADSTAKAAADALTLAMLLRQRAAAPDVGLAQWEQLRLTAGHGMAISGIELGDRIMGLTRT